MAAVLKTSFELPLLSRIAKWLEITAAILKIYFELLNWKANWLKTCLVLWCYSAILVCLFAYRNVLINMYIYGEHSSRRTKHVANEVSSLVEIMIKEK